MIGRHLLAAAVAAVLLGAAGSAGATPPPSPQDFDVLNSFKAELAAGTLSQADYDDLMNQARLGVNDIVSAAARSVARSGITDPNASQGLEQAIQDYNALKASDPTGALVQLAVNGSQSAINNYAKPVVTEGQLIFDNVVHLEQQLVTARSHMPGAIPAVIDTQQQTLAHAQTLVDDGIAQAHSGMDQAATTLGNMTPDQQRAAAAKLQAQIDAGALIIEPDGTIKKNPDYQPPPPEPPPPWATSNAPPDDTPAPGPVVTNTPATHATRPRDPNLAPSGVDQNSADFKNPPMPQQPQQQPPQQQPPQPPPPLPPQQQQPPLDPVVLVKQQPASELPTEQWHYSPIEKDANGNPLLLYVKLSDGSTAYYGKDANGNAVPTLVVDPQGNYHQVDDQGHISPNVLNFADDGYGDLNAHVTLPSLTAPKTATLNAQHNGPGTNDHSTFQGYENGGMYTVANVQPIYAHWHYGPGNQGSIMQTPDLYPPGPSSVMNTPHPDVFGPSSVMWSLSSSDNLSGLSMNSGLRVGTPIGPDWSLPYIDVPRFDDMTGPQFDDLLLCGR